MWYDATSAAGSLEADGLPGQGQDRLRRRAGRARPTASGLALHLGLGASRRPARSRTTPGSSSPGRRARSTRSWSASKLGWSRVPGRQARLDLREPGLPEGRRRRSPSRPRARSRAPTRATPACSRGRRSASSSSTSRSSPTSGTRSRRTSARRSPGRRRVDEALDKGQQARRGRRPRSTRSEASADDEHRSSSRQADAAPSRAPPRAAEPPRARRAGLGRGAPRCCPR